MKYRTTKYEVRLRLCRAYFVLGTSDVLLADQRLGGGSDETGGGCLVAAARWVEDEAIHTEVGVAARGFGVGQTARRDADLQCSERGGPLVARDGLAQP